MTLADVLPYLSSVIAISIAIGGLFAFRQGYSKAVGEIQQRVITALKEEIETLENRIETSEKDMMHNKQILATIQAALKRRGLTIQINGEFITLIDEQMNQKTSTMHVRIINELPDADKEAL